MTDATEKRYQDVIPKATKGMGWNFLSFGGTKILSLATLFILAHILPPENFKLVALVTLTMDYLSIISDIGFGVALIQRKGDIEESANIALIIIILANIILTVIIFIIAPYSATFFREPMLTSVLRWLGLTFLFKSIGSIQNVLLAHELGFKKKMIPDLGSSIIMAAVSIGLVWLGFGVWALVVGQLIGVATSSFCYCFYQPGNQNLRGSPV